ncbi:MAG TPA: DNA polymerase III subunit beta [Candidatus Saccharimonadales bacterium]|nr:DNA polymerase III subunit beta [Candidatus Saccharimonadales bacterium]
MRLQVTQENLSKALSVVARIASGKTPLPILNNVLLKTEQNRLLLAATNLELAVTEYVGGKIEEEGSLTVPARLMTELVSNLPKGNVELISDQHKLHVKTTNYNATINGMVADEFPSLPSVSNQNKITLPAHITKRAIQQTVLVVSGDDTRPVLTGVYAHTHNGKLYFAATDGYRLAERQLVESSAQLQSIIPADTLQEVLRVLTDDIEEVEFWFDETQVRIRIGEIDIVSRLIDGTFPDYRQLIPDTNETSAVLDKEELVRITKIASLFARDSGGSITIEVDETTKTVSIHSVASQVGENDANIEAEVTGSGRLTLNSRYVLEALGCIDEKSVKFAFNGKLSPCVLTAATKQVDYKHIVMPLKS